MDNTTGNARSFFDRQRTLIKGFFIGFLIIIMLIPTALMMTLVHEREERQRDVVSEISQKWAVAQYIYGPILYVPYYEDSYNKTTKETKRVKKYCYLLPETLDINSKVIPEVRHRSIYDVTVYSSEISMSGKFNTSTLRKMNIAEEDIIYNEAKLLMSLNDNRGLHEEIKLLWNKDNKVMEANTDVETGVDMLGTTVSINKDTVIPFTVSMGLNGTDGISFIPVGKSTKVHLTSSWKDPSFSGNYLPNTSTVNDSGFIADWKVSHVSRSYPQFGNKLDWADLNGSAFGVRLIQPIDHYSKTERSVKYAILIIALTFVVFFLLEIIQKKMIHPLQYVLVGIALSVFYTLLLSISEYTGFDLAYLIASIATVSLITWYVYGIFKKGKVAAGFSAALASLYMYIYFLIQLKDYALLFGSIGLFIIVFIVMYSSRNIDWYNTALTKSIDVDE